MKWPCDRFKNPIDIDDYVVIIDSGHIEVGKVIKFSKSSVHIGFDPRLEPICSKATNCQEQCDNPSVDGETGDDWKDFHICGAPTEIEFRTAMKRTPETMLVLDSKDPIVEAAKVKYPFIRTNREVMKDAIGREIKEKDYVIMTADRSNFWYGRVFESTDKQIKVLERVWNYNGTDQISKCTKRSPHMVLLADEDVIKSILEDYPELENMDNYKL